MYSTTTPIDVSHLLVSIILNPYSSIPPHVPSYSNPPETTTPTTMPPTHLVSTLHSSIDFQYHSSHSIVSN